MQAGSDADGWRTGLRGAIRIEEDGQVQTRREESGEESREQPQEGGATAGWAMNRELKLQRLY